jgi:vacuolar-type H+-ATPase subunit D/Vma8
MDLGTSITASVSIAGFFITVLKLISVYTTRTDMETSRTTGSDTCSAHAQTNQTLSLAGTKLCELEERISILNDDIDTIKRTVVAIASFLNIPIKEIKIEMQDLLR